MLKTLKSSTLAIALTLTSVAVLAPAAHADRSRQSTVTTSNGRTATMNRAISRDGSTVTRQGSVQTGQGFGATHNSTAGYDQDAGVRYRNSTTTTNSGQQISRSNTAGCADGTCSRSSVVTGPAGGSAAHDVTRYVDENGNYVKDSALYGPNGQTYDREVVRDGEGTKSTTATGPNGTRSRTRWIQVN